jgi:hypothetical protein
LSADLELCQHSLPFPLLYIPLRKLFLYVGTVANKSNRFAPGWWISEIQFFPLKKIKSVETELQSKEWEFPDMGHGTSLNIQQPVLNQ